MIKLKQINFWERLYSFVKEVNVNDPMSEEEKEMILRIAKEYKESCKLIGIDSEPTNEEIINWANSIEDADLFSEKQKYIAITNRVRGAKWMREIYDQNKSLKTPIQ